MKNKKAAEMTIGTIIVIILALVVLVVLIYGFTTGWANLFEKIGVFGGGKANVQTIVQGCQLACTTSSEYDWCSKQRNIIVDDEANVGKTKVLAEKTCKDLSAIGKYGLEECTGITCAVVEEGTCDGIITSVCSSKNNLGADECVKLIGCKWNDDVNEKVDNLKGTCIIDATILCSKYNKDPTTCKTISGCTWNANPIA
ncbi:MAG: hypothetical protein AABW67_01205 [Nanoarchaeota archaeon]